MNTNPTRGLHRFGALAVLFLSIVALATVLTGIGRPPEPDEGTAAHVFQLSVAAILPALLLYLFTADMQRPWREARWLAIAGVVLGLAFTLLYWMEHHG